MENFEKGTGAIKDVIDDRDIQYGNIAMGTPDFDWEKGFDVEEELSEIIGKETKILSKDQNGSSSCGGQGWGYYGAVLEAIATKSYEERSAKFIYANTHVESGGSAGRTNSDFVVNKGWATEISCCSYDRGMAPGEAFMRAKEDITAEAYNIAKKAKALVYANVETNIDLFAKAIRDNHGMVMGISGKNNGTWSGKYPKAPDTLIGVWNHWMYCGKAKMIKGKKYIGAINSWGEDTGDKGWQWFDEDYFKYNETYKGYYIWSGWTMVFKGEDPEFKYTFSETMRMGSRGVEVNALQKALELEGMFKGVKDGIFGKITLAAVKTFQARYSLGVDGIVGPKTRGKLNEKYSE